MAITEFGARLSGDAADLSDRGDIVEWGVWRSTGSGQGQTRDKNEQARYVRESLDVFEAEGLDHVFVYTFARYDPGASHEDVDMASAAVAKVLEDSRGLRYPDMPWKPKAAFNTLAEYYGR